MDDIYNDLENYDEVDLVNELRSENSDLKHKLVKCTTSMEILQKSILQDFDKLSAEFKKLEMNYSSLLKIARAEIKRKTDMITNLNIEKDILIIKATQSVPPNKVQNLMKNIGSETKRKKKRRNKKEGQKKKDEFKREDCEPSETSSTATDNTKMLSKDRGDSTKSICRNTTKENKIVKPEAFPDRRRDDCRSPVGAVVDRRVSELARPPLAKLSSDEEFEDMYSAFGPKTPPPREPERSRKRGRDRSQDARTYNSFGPQDKPSGYPEPFRECFVRNKANRFSASDRNFMNRDKEYNECDRNMSRDKQYSENDRNANRGNYHRKYSPERQRRIARESGDDRYSHQYDRHRRLESPPRERFRHRSRERRPHYDRQRDDHNPGVRRYDHPDTHSVKHRIHGEYDEPQNKRPRVELHPNEQDDRRQSEKQYYSNTDVRDRTCQSPDFSHTENESSNEPVITTTDSIEVTTEEREDPRVTSNKYVKTIVGTKEVLHAVNANEVDLQPVNRSLWNLEDIQVPLALKRGPLEISEELMEEMDTDKPLSILSMESGEVGSETTDTYMDDLSDYREVDEGIQSNYKLVSSKNNKLIIEKRSVVRSPTDKTSENIDHKSDVVQMESKLTRHKLAKLEEATNYCRADDDPKMPTKEFSGPWEVDEGISLNYKSVSNKNDNLKIEKRKDVKSRTDTTSKNVGHASDVVQLGSKSAKHKVANSEVTNYRADKDSTKPNKDLLDHREVDEVVGLEYKCFPSQKDNLRLEKRKDKKSPSEKTSQETEHKYDVVQLKSKSIRHKIGKSEGATNCFRSDDGLKMPSKEFSLHRNVDEGISSNYKGVSNKNENLKIDGRKDKKSPIEETSKVIEHESDVVQTDLKSTRHKLSKSEEDSNKDDNTTHCKNAEKPSILQRLLIHSVHDKSEKSHNHKADKPTTKSSQENNKVEPDVYCDNTEKPSISHNSVSDMHKNPESVDIVESKSTEVIEPKNISVLTTINNSEKEKESNVSVFRDFEHRVYSTRHIVEGDLALSDDTTDEILVKKDEKVPVKKKLKTKRKSHRDTSTEKSVDSEDTTKKTKSKKNKVQQVKPQNKFSELFGDSSSLITPEELNLATREAHALPAECCPPLCEDAQDGIILIHKLDQIPHISECKENASGLISIDDNLKTTNDSKNRTHQKPKDTAGVSVSNDAPKDPKELLNEAQHQKVDSTDGQLVSEIKLVLSSEKLKEMRNAKLSSCDKNKSDLIKSHEKPKETLKSNKKPKSKHEKKLSTSDSTDESNIKRANSLGTSSNEPLVVGENKENANCNDNSDKNISSEMEKIFETVSSKNTSIQGGKVNEEKIQLNESAIEAISSSNTAQDVPNLAPAIDEPGLVKTVVISTGNHHIDSTVQYIKPLNALASSTPAKEIPVMNTTEEESKNKQTACINVTIASEDSVSQSEADAPDVRINFYRRRRKVKK